jgi:F-type H+-transporting ATPase subunit alpha
MDDIQIADIRRFEDGLRQFFVSRQPGLLGEIRDTGKLPEAETVDAAINEFKETFERSGAEE